MWHGAVDTHASAAQHEVLLKKQAQRTARRLVLAHTYTQPTLLDQAAGTHKETLHNYTAPLYQGRGR
jgi:hypothetical protein